MPLRVTNIEQKRVYNFEDKGLLFCFRVTWERAVLPDMDYYTEALIPFTVTIEETTEPGQWEQRGDKLIVYHRPSVLQSKRFIQPFLI